jgi:hypothetical protein
MASALEGHLRIEAESLAHELDRLPPLSQVEIAVRCHEGWVELEVGLTGRSTRASRQIDTQTAPPETHSRLVALAVGELIYAMINAPAERPVVPKPSPPPPALPPPPTDRSVHLLATASVYHVGQPAMWLGGLGAALDYAPTRSFALVAHPQITLGATEVPNVGVEVFSVVVAAHALVGNQQGHLRWGVGPSVRVGWAQLVGRPRTADLQGRTLAASWGAIGVAVRALYAPADGPIAFSATLEGALITLPIRGTLDNTSNVFALDGTWMGATLGAGW